MYIDYLTTPLGMLEIQASASAITGVNFVDEKMAGLIGSTLIDTCKKQLTEYFEGTRKTFDLPVFGKGTPFQQSVWAALLPVPFGQTASYGDIAIAIKNPKAVRAVGAANGKNPVSIIVPCHRIIGSNGTLTGYAGGLDRKAWLLNHEGINLNPRPSAHIYTN